MNKVAIYVRVSTTMQAEEGYSIDEQIDKLTSYCKIKDWTVYEIYKDGGFSGSNIERPAMEKLISDAKRKRFDTVLVYKLDRLSRSQKDTLFLIEEIFGKNDISFLSLNESFDTSTPFGKAMIGILSVFAQLEREQIKERMLLGKMGRAKSGKPMMTSTISFGYTYDKYTDTLNINPAEAIVVKKIFDEYLGGRSLTKLRDYLNENEILRQGKAWNYQGLRRILSNPVYIGMVRYKNEIFPGNHQPIIDVSDYDKTQEEIKKRQIEALEFSNNPRPFRAKYMLSGMAKCGYCGTPLQIVLGTKRKDGTRSMRYQCINRFPRKTKGITIYNDGKKCNSGMYEKADIEEYVIGKIRLLQLNSDMLDDMFDKYPVIDVEGLERQITAIENKMKKLNDLYLNDMIELDELKKQTHALRRQKNMLENEIANNPAITQEKNKKHFKEMLGAKDITKLNYETQKSIVNNLINKVFVKSGYIKVEWKV
ncbi:recombinase family protein [Streptococcus suis]